MIDLMAILLSWNPLHRPTAKSILNSVLMNHSYYETIQMKQYSKIALYSRSPSKSIRERILLPLRRLAADVMENQDNILVHQNQLMSLFDMTLSCIREPQQQIFEEEDHESLRNTVKSNLGNTFE